MNWKHYGLLALSLLIAIGPGLEAWLNQHGQSPYALAVQGLLAFIAARAGLKMVPPSSEEKKTSSVPPLAVVAFAAGVSLVAPGTTACKALPDPAPVVSTLPALGACVVTAALSDIVAAIEDPLSVVPVIMAACSQYGKLTIDSIIAYIESAFTNQPSFGPADGGPAEGGSDAGIVAVASAPPQHTLRLGKALAAAKKHRAALTQP